MTDRIGRRDTITSGMVEFCGRTGTIVGAEYTNGRNPLYRVRLDEPVEISGVGLVRDDLWESRYLRTIAYRAGRVRTDR